MRSKKVFFAVLLSVALGVTLADFSSVHARKVRKGSKANAPAIELTTVIKKWQDEKLDSDQVRKIVQKQFTKTWQRVNVIGVVKGTKKISVLPKPGLSRKYAKNSVVTKMEFYQKGGFTFEFYLLLPKGESYPDGDKLSIQNAYIESNRGYRRPAIKLVLIGGTVEQLPPD